MNMSTFVFAHLTRAVYGEQANVSMKQPREQPWIETGSAKKLAAFFLLLHRIAVNDRIGRQCARVLLHSRGSVSRWEPAWKADMGNATTSISRKKQAMPKRIAPMVRLGQLSQACYFGQSIPEALDLVPKVGAEALIALEKLPHGQGVNLYPGSFDDPMRKTVVLPIAYKEATPTELNKGLQSADSAKLPAVRLAVAVLAQCYLNGSEGLLITQRANRRESTNRSTWNSLWVFPGGSVDVGESLEDAAMREFYEETGLTLNRGSLRMIATWQAAASVQQKQYFVVMFAGYVEQDHCHQDLSLLNLQRDEVAAAAFLPMVHLDVFCSSWFHALDPNGVVSLSADELKSRYSHLMFDGWEVEGDEQRFRQYNWSSLEGDGGRFSGVGGGHRFAIRHYLRSASPRSPIGNQLISRAKL